MTTESKSSKERDVRDFKYRVGDIVKFNGGDWHVREVRQTGELVNSVGKWEKLGVCVPYKPQYVLTATPFDVNITVSECWITEVVLPFSSFHDNNQ